ncbi:MAG: hypothetical protein KF678_02400 [Phycisphaeraceae bacterium]|nr:hypothetical protein [Phycisphaeraceae bacterium]
MNPVRAHPLPHLPPSDHALLLRYLSLNEDLSQLSKEPNAPDILSLLLWLSRPEIAAYIAAYRTHQNQLHRQAVIDALRSVLASSTDQVEIRRAATTLLRALSHGGTPLRGVRTPSSTPASAEGAPAHRTRGGAAPAPPSSTHPPHARVARTHQAPSVRPSPLSDLLAPSPLHPSTPSSPPPSPSTPPLPSPNPLAEALAAFGLPTGLDELDRLDDELDDAEDDAELDAFADYQDPPPTTNTS